MSRAFRLEAQVQSKLQQIERLRSLASKVTSNTANEPVSHTRDVTEMQDAVIRIMEEEEILKNRIKMLMDVKEQIRDVIEHVDDVTLQLILEKRYLLYESIKEIAADLGYTYRWTEKKHKKALQEADRIIDERYELDIWTGDHKSS
jgi:hypothetical protein